MVVVYCGIMFRLKVSKLDTRILENLEYHQDEPLAAKPFIFFNITLSKQTKCKVAVALLTTSMFIIVILTIVLLTTTQATTTPTTSLHISPNASQLQYIGRFSSNYEFDMVGFICSLNPNTTAI